MQLRDGHLFHHITTYTFNDIEKIIHQRLRRVSIEYRSTYYEERRLMGENPQK